MVSDVLGKRIDFGFGVSVSIEEAKDSFSCRDWSVINSEAEDE